MVLRILTFFLAMATAVAIPLSAGAAGGAQTTAAKDDATVVSQACDPNKNITLVTPPANLVFKRGYFWQSCRGYKFIFQTDGNLVVYNPGNRAIWQSGTLRKARKLIWQTDGNLVLYNRKNRPIWSSKTPGRGARLVIQGDGNVVIYSSRNKPLWTTGTHGG